MENNYALLTIVRPKAVKIICIVNAAAAVIHLIFWTLAFIKLPSPLSFESASERANMAVSYGFGFADLLFSLPLLAISSFGLWKFRFWGWFTAQLANMCWFYSFSVLITKDLYTGKITPGTAIFLPFAIFSVWIAIYLWKMRESFMGRFSSDVSLAAK
ncbi:MAG: hypothetical protein ACM3Q2_17995 [Syntrophothermus sp.]